MTQPRAEKGQLIEALVAKGVDINASSTTAHCSACSQDIVIDRQRFVRTASGHFRSSTHQSKAGWVLKVNKTNKFYIENATDIQTLIRGQDHDRLSEDIADQHHGHQIQTHEHEFLDNPPAPVDVLQSDMPSSHPSASSSITNSGSSHQTSPDLHPTILDTLKIPEKYRTQERINAILEAPFIAEAIKNIIVNVGPSDGKPNRNAHNHVVKDTITKFGCLRGSAAALDLSTLLRGISRSTLYADLAGASPILSWYEEDNILMHLEKAKGNKNNTSKQ